MQNEVIVLDRIQGVIKKRSFPTQPQPREQIVTGLEIQSNPRIENKPLVDKARSVPTTQCLLKARPHSCPKYKSILPWLGGNFCCRWFR